MWMKGRDDCSRFTGIHRQTSVVLLVPQLLSPLNEADTCMPAKSLQPCPTLCHPMHCSSPGRSVHRDSPGKNTGVGPPPGDLPNLGIEPASLTLVLYL